jgi:competence protein ComK
MTEIRVLPNYEINKETMALIPAKHFDYETIVLESNQTLYIKQRPMEMIKAACLEGGSTYEGRRKAVIYQSVAQHKVPIPIHPAEQIFAFPTHSPDLYECHWLFYHHVKSITPDPKTPRNSIITFTNHGEPLIIDVSHNSLEKQLQRTSFCIVRFSYTPHHI